MEDIMAKAKSLETAFGELEEKIASLESGELSLEASFKAYAEGMKLVKYCNDAIDKVEKKMIQIKAEDEESHEF